MKRLTLNPFQNRILSIFLVIVLLGLIHANINDTIKFITTTFHPLIQIVIAGLLLGFAGILVGVSKVRQAGYSGPFIENQKTFFKQLEIELSIKGILVLLGFLCQLFIFSLSLYCVGALFLFYFGFI